MKTPSNPLDQWPLLTPIEADHARGSPIALAQLVALKYHLPQVEAKRQVEEWLAGRAEPR
jgi:hypothetical protein